MPKTFLILPGQNPTHNQKWVEDISTQLKIKHQDSEIHTIVYEHWKDKKLSPSTRTESEKLYNFAQNMDKFSIIAKSFGTIVTLAKLTKIQTHLEHVTILGYPSNPSEPDLKNMLDKTLKDNKIPILFCQQEEDKYTHAILVKNYLETLANPNIQFKQILGSDHAYDQFDLYL